MIEHPLHPDVNKDSLCPVFTNVLCLRVPSAMARGAPSGRFLPNHANITVSIRELEQRLREGLEWRQQRA